MGAKIHIIIYTTKYDVLIFSKSRIIVYKNPMFVIFLPHTDKRCLLTQTPSENKILCYVY